MPKMNFTNSEIGRAKLCDRQTWFTDAAPNTGHNRYPGLRLCISKTAKTFYVAKWNPNTETTEQHKLGRHAPNFTLPQAWQAALAKAQDVEQPPEPDVEELPTLREALEEFVTYRLNLNPKVGKPMTPETAYKYRKCVEHHLAKWADMRIDTLPTLDIRRHLNKLQSKIPYGAQYVHTAIGATIRFQNKERGLDLKVPGLTTVTKTGIADVDRDLSWQDRWDEIDAVENPWIRAAWKFRWLTGVRVKAFHQLRWSDVSFDFGTVSLPDDKRVGKRVIGVADAVLEIFRDLPRVNEYVFASTQKPGQGHIYAKLDRLELNVSRHLRHLWHDVLIQQDISQITSHWLAGQTDRDIQAHYSVPPIEKQRAAANAIADHILGCAKPSPANVVDLVG